MSKYFELLQGAGKDLYGPIPQNAPDFRRDTENEPYVVPAHNPESARNTWLNAIDVLRKHRKVSGIFALVVMLTVTLTTLLTKPVYEPIARIEVDPQGELLSLGNNGSGPSDAEYLETQAQNLRSENLALAVIRNLHLDEVSPGARKISENKANGAGNGALLTASEEATLKDFQSNLNVRRDTSSRLILVSYGDHDPRVAATVTNALVSTFIEDTFQTRHQAIAKSTEWLSRQLDDIRAKMEDSTRSLADYQRTLGITDLDENKSTYTEHMSQLNQQLTQAQSEKIQIAALLKSVQAGDADSLPEVRNNPVVQQLTQKLGEERAQLAQVLVVYGSNHPSAQKLQREVSQLNEELDGQKKAIVNSLRASYAAADAREKLMAGEVKGTTKQLDQMARYATLKKEVQNNVELYNSLYSRIKEAGISAASKSGNIRIIDSARVLNSPTSPNRKLNLAIGLLVAIGGAIALAFIREELDGRLRTPDDLTKWTGKSNIAIIPVVGKESLNFPVRRDALPVYANRLGQSAPFVVERPHSPEAEALSSLQASIMFSQKQGWTPRVVMVVSSFPGEGKTTVALNLALSLCQQGNTCLVDADLRKREISTNFGLQDRPGIAEVLAGTRDVSSVLETVSESLRLTVAPAGRPKMNPAQLVCSPNAKQLIEDLRQKFQFVVIDSVPILPFADGRVLAPMADALIFVGRAGVTTREAMQRSIQLLSDVHAAPILEFVLNAADMTSPGYKYYQYGYSAYSDHGV